MWFWWEKRGERLEIHFFFSVVIGVFFVSGRAKKLLTFGVTSGDPSS